MIKAAIFDMDGLLIDSEPLWRRAELDAFKLIGVKLTDEEVHGLLGRGIVAYVEEIYRMYPWEGHTTTEIGNLIIKDLIDLVEAEGKLKPGVLQVIEMLKAKNIPLAIASSSPMKVIDAIVDKLSIRDYFDHIYSAEHEPYAKPHPGVFITTANLLDAIPEECLVFEDAPSGVLAAKAARMKCVAVPEAAVKDHKFIQTADAVISSLEQFGEKMLAAL
jgi:sugar-phosphatase